MGVPSEEYHLFHMAGEALHELIEILSLGVPARDEDNILIKRCNGCLRRIRVRSLGIVIIPDAADRPAVFYAVFNAAELPDAPGDDFRIDAREIADRRRSQGVHMVMLSDDLHLIGPADRDLRSLIVPDGDHTVFQECSVFQFCLSAEGHHFGRTPLCQRPACLVIIVDHKMFRCRLVGEDLRLGGAVCFHRMMPVQVIRRQVEYGRNHRVEITGRFQLKTAAFRDHPVFFARFRGSRYHGDADIAYHMGLSTRLLEYFSRKACGRGLSVCSRNCHILPMSQAVSEFQFTDDLRSRSSRFLNKVKFRRYSGTEHHHLVLADIRRLLSKAKHCALLPESGNELRIQIIFLF